MFSEAEILFFFETVFWLCILAILLMLLHVVVFQEEVTYVDTIAGIIALVITGGIVVGYLIFVQEVSLFKLFR